MTLSKEPKTDERVPGNDYTLSSSAQMCTGWPEKLKRRGLVSFTVSADTASRQNTPSLSVHPWLWWNRQLLLQTQRADDRQECHSQYQCLGECKVFCCGVKKKLLHIIFLNLQCLFLHNHGRPFPVCYRLWSELKSQTWDWNGSQHGSTSTSSVYWAWHLNTSGGWEDIGSNPEVNISTESERMSREEVDIGDIDKKINT